MGVFQFVAIASLLSKSQSHGFHVATSYRQRCATGPLLQSTSDESENHLKFYSLEGGMCPYAARTWITLLELGLPFELIEVNARRKEQWFLDINPRGKVPAIQNTKDGTVIYESSICNEYLSDYARQLDGGSAKNDDDVWKLAPVDAGQRALMRLLNDHIDTQLGPAQYTLLMNDDPDKDYELERNLEDALDILQTALITRGGPYLMGKHFTLADAHVLPFFLRLVVSLKHFKGYEIPADEFAVLLEWYAVCSERDSVKAVSKSDEKIVDVYQKFIDMKYSFGGLNQN